MGCRRVVGLAVGVWRLAVGLLPARGGSEEVWCDVKRQGVGHDLIDGIKDLHPLVLLLCGCLEGAAHFRTTDLRLVPPGYRGDGMDTTDRIRP